MFSQDGMIMVNPRNLEWDRQCDQGPMMFPQVGVMRNLHWESHLGQNLELREASLVICQEGGLLVHNMELS